MTGTGGVDRLAEGGGLGSSGLARRDLDCVLVVDDSPSDARLIVEVLTEAGVRRGALAVAGSLREARRFLSENHVDCILLDLDLPDAVGLEGVRILSSAAPEVPVIVVTGASPDGVVYASLAEGADEYLSKADLSATSVGQLLVRAVRRRVGSERTAALWQSAAEALDRVDVAAVAIDGTGRIIATNARWADAAEVGNARAMTTGPGVNYLRTCDLAAGPFSEGAAEAAEGIRAVLDGQLDRFSLDYACPDHERERWFTLRATPLGELGGGAIVTHLDITALKLAEHRLRGAELPFQDLGGEETLYAVVDDRGVVAHASRAMTDMTGLRPGDRVGESMDGRMDPADFEAARSAWRRVRAVAREDVVLRLRDPEGRWRELDLTITKLPDERGVGAMMVSGRDITESRLAQITRRIEARMLQRAPIPIAVSDERGVIVYWNDRAALTLGYSRGEVIGRSAFDLRILPYEAEASAALIEALESGDVWEGDYGVQRRDGEVVPVHATVERIEDPEIDFVGHVAAWVDLTERRKLEEELAFQALHDPLTMLPNRRLFVDHLSHAIDRCRSSSATVAVFFLDLDDFKAINDRVGHVAADEILRTVGELLSAVLHPGDMAARLGGDEFIICCEGLADPAAAAELGDRILKVVSAPFRVGDELITLSASVGVAVSGAGTQPEALLRDADAAMYAAKLNGKARLELFDKDLSDQVQRRHELGRLIDDALADRSIFTVFQPQYDLRSGSLVGFEALARWLLPEEGPVSPAEFIPIAEQSGRIGAVGRRILEEACTGLGLWSTVAPEQELKVAVNVSPTQLLDPEFPDLVADVLQGSGVAPGRVCLEITESALIDPDIAAHALRRLKALGVQIAIDDFGTGYSSLSRLHRFPLDYLKIDRAFVAGMMDRAEDEVIVASVLALGHGLGLDVVAEGIEDEAQLVQLAAFGCEVGQGFLLGPPLSIDDATHLVSENVPLAEAAKVEWLPPAGVRPGTSSGELSAEAAISLLGHELATPLTVIGAYVDLLRGAQTADEIETALDAMGRAAEQAAAVLQLVRDTTASGAGTLRLELGASDARSLVVEAARLTRHLFESDPHVDLQDHQLLVDRRRVIGALANLLSNAAKHAGRAADVTIKGAVSEGHYVITVVDDGPGVPSDKVGTIFRRFGRVNTKADGTGLGLFVAREAARAHAGDLRYRSAAGGGAEFILELPISPVGAADPGAQQ